MWKPHVNNIIILYILRVLGQVPIIMWFLFAGKHIEKHVYKTYKWLYHIVLDDTNKIINFREIPYVFGCLQ